MNIPNWLRGIVDENGLEQIRQSVIGAELKTSGEIVPMLVHRSISTGHVPVILFLAQALILWFLLPYLAPYFSDIPYWVFEVGAVVVAGVSTWLQSDLDFWQRVLTSPSDRDESVMRRAQLEFYQSGIKKTQSSTGVLIMVSLLEHEAVILADKAVADQISNDTWETIIEKLLIRVKAGEFADGMSEAIASVGDLLRVPFPIRPGDHNELPNPLVIKE